MNTARRLTQVVGSPEQAGSPVGRDPSAGGMGAIGQVGTSGTVHERVEADQRARISQALVEVLAERGYAGATVGLVLKRAGVSSRTFYELYGGLEECLIGVMDWAMQQTAMLAARALEGEECWEDGVRAALAAVLMFFDSEPELARVCLVETLAGGLAVLEHRERIIEMFRIPVAERIERDVPGASPLAAEGVMSSVLGIMHAHIVTARPGTFLELLGPLMGLATAPYLGAQNVQREIERGDLLAREIRDANAAGAPPAMVSVPGAGQDSKGDSGRRAALGHGVVLGQGAAVAVDLPAMLQNPSARRARECLLFLAEQSARGLTPSNGEVAAGIGVAHRSQVSALLAELAEEGLVVKDSQGAGKRNSWRLTPRGKRIARTLLE